MNRRCLAAVAGNSKFALIVYLFSQLSVITTVSTMVNVLNQRAVLALQDTVVKDARFVS